MTTLYQRAWKLGTESKHSFKITTAIGYGLLLLGGSLMVRSKGGEELLEFLILEIGNKLRDSEKEQLNKKYGKFGEALTCDRCGKPVRYFDTSGTQLCLLHVMEQMSKIATP